jgi:hypothetical protein
MFFVVFMTRSGATHVPSDEVDDVPEFGRALRTNGLTRVQ